MRKIALIATVLILLQISLVALVLVQERTWGGPDEDTAAGVAVAPTAVSTLPARR